MVDPSTEYETARMSVLVEPGERAPWMVLVNRRQSERFVGASAVAWCATLGDAQDLARMLVGVEITREGAAIWPDGRTAEPTIAERIEAIHAMPTNNPGETVGSLLADLNRSAKLAQARDLLCRLLEIHGRLDSPVWDEARAFLRGETLETGESEQ